MTQCTWMQLICLSFCIWWHPYYSSPMVSHHQKSILGLVLHSPGDFKKHCFSSLVINYRPWRHITQYSAMDLSRRLEPALFCLLRIRRAASAGPQPAVSGNLWPVLSLENVECTETKAAHGVQCQLDVLGSLLLRKDGDIVQNDELKKAVEKCYARLCSCGTEETFPAVIWQCPTNNEDRWASWYESSTVQRHGPSLDICF